MYFSFLRWLHRFTEPNHSSRIWYPLAGLYECLWARYCGHDWKFARRMGMIYWWPKDPEEAPFDAILESSDKMILADAAAKGENVAEITSRMRSRISKAMDEAKRRSLQAGDGQ